jgi:DNA-binding MarR family transcriptional regulator
MRKARTPITELEDIRRALVTLRRLFQRKELAELWAAAFGEDTQLDYTELRLLDAVGIGESTTVGDVAQRLGIDPSRASRQVSRAVASGLLERRAEQRDGRKVVLAVTKAGAALQRRGSDLTRARIELATDGWTARDRRQFAALFGRFADGITK